MIEEFDKWASIPENRDLLYDILDREYPELKDQETSNEEKNCH